MIEDKAKALEVKTLEHEEENLSPLEVFCQRSQSMFIFQRVWAAKEVGNLLVQEPREIALGVLVPIAMRLADDHELFVRETMAQDLAPVLHYYYANKAHTDEINSAAAKTAAEAEAAEQSQPDSDADSLAGAELELVGDNEAERGGGVETAAAGDAEASSTGDRELSGGCDKALPPVPKHRTVVPPVCAPSEDEFGAWLHRVLLTPHPSVSLPTQRAAVSLGRRLGFGAYHTEIVHGVILGLVKSPIQQQIMRQRSKDIFVKPRRSGSPPPPLSCEAGRPRSSGGSSSMLSNGLATLFGRRSWQSDTAGSQRDDTDSARSDEQDGDAIFLGDGDPAPGGAFFVSPVDSEARLEQTRRKLLMLHMIHLVATEFGAEMRPAVFVPVVERSTKDKTFEVRRDAAAVLGSLAKAVSTDLALDVLFPCFLQLIQDTIWQVRQSAARHAMPGLALVLAARTSRPLSASLQMADFERKHSLQHFARPASGGLKADSARADAGLGIDVLQRGGAADDGDPVAAYMYRNQLSRSVPDKQWLQLVDRLASTREPSHHVRAAVFESVGKLVLALVDCPRTRDALVALVVSDIGRAHGDQAVGRLGLFGSTGSLQSLDEDESDEPDEEADAAAEETAVALHVLSEVHGAPPQLQPKLAAAKAKEALRTRTTRARAVGHDVLYHSAFNFPALLAALGPLGWDRLRDAYMQLSKTEHYEVRQTLACSLHEVARLLAATHAHGQAAMAAAAPARLAAHRVSANGAQGASALSSHSADLESVLCLFLIDGAEIKMGALAHLGDTLTWLTAASRVRCLPMIMQVFKHDGKQWRTREVMAAQLVKLCHLFPASIVVGSLLPQAVEWAHDPVAGVRAAVAPAFPIMFELTKLDPSTQVKFFETVISFSHASSFRGRLFFVEICAALLAHDQDPDADPVDFDQFFLPSLAALATDRVANVRIALARLVRRMLENRMRRKSISVTLADMWVPPPMPMPQSHAERDDASVDDDWVDEAERSVSSTDGAQKPADGADPAAPRPRGLRRRSSSAARRRRASGMPPSHLQRSNTRGSVGDVEDCGSPSSTSGGGGAVARRYAHRSLGSTVGRRPRRNTTPMRAHLLATMVQQLAMDTDRDVLDLIRGLPGPSSTAAHGQPQVPVVPSKPAADDPSEPPAQPLRLFPQPQLSPPLCARQPAPGDRFSMSALDELLPSYERDDDGCIGMSAISQPLPQRSAETLDMS
ncbi:hypothetical protein LPJ61_003524 [Coemansia biformis]|uniref:ARM repeat-containing protein n=1 Tax=Coemansia biformis TaxID=1286918 RepID=A0A9W7YAE0_9FUNG|nr:hypothetical protein LPJ61_003524 [Coemansia biformis]